MKKNLLFIFIGLMAVIAGGLASCSDGGADAKVNKFVEQLKSDTFQEQTMKSGVFTGSEAELVDDAVVLTFRTIPGLSFKNAPKVIMNAQKEEMVSQFKRAVPDDELFREGFEGMKEKGLLFRMTFLDTNGGSASIEISPSEVLE